MFEVYYEIDVRARISADQYLALLNPGPEGTRIRAIDFFKTTRYRGAGDLRKTSTLREHFDRLEVLSRSYPSDGDLARVTSTIYPLEDLAGLKVWLGHLGKTGDSSLSTRRDRFALDIGLDAYCINLEEIEGKEHLFEVEWRGTDSPSNVDFHSRRLQEILHRFGLKSISEEDYNQLMLDLVRDRQ